MKFALWFCILWAIQAGAQEAPAPPADPGQASPYPRGFTPAPGWKPAPPGTPTQSSPQPPPANDLESEFNSQPVTTPQPSKPKPVAKKRRKKKKPPINWNEVLGPSGSLRAGYADRDKMLPAQSKIGYGALWLNLKPEKVRDVTSYFEANVQNTNIRGTPQTVADLREGYLESSLGLFDFKVGRQITVWGRADKVNPTDNLSVRNSTRMGADDEEQRTGLIAAQVAANFGDTRLIGIWQPEWREPKFPITPLPPGVELSSTNPTGAQNQFGLKLDRTGGRVDFSLSFWNGIDRVPNFKILSSSATQLNLAFDYLNIRVYGGDFAFNLGSYGFRGEASYTKTTDDHGNDPLVKNSFWYGVLGVDRTFYEHFNASAQYLFKHVDQWVDPASLASPISSALESAENLNSNQGKATLNGCTARFAYKGMNDTLEAEVSYTRWWSNRDSTLVKTKISYSFSDHWKGFAGRDAYFGPVDSFFGRYHDLTTDYVELRYLF